MRPFFIIFGFFAVLWIRIHSHPELFGQVGFESELIVPVPDMAFLAENLYNFFRYLFAYIMEQ
jgi:hypothetical protein